MTELAAVSIRTRLGERSAARARQISSPWVPGRSRSSITTPQGGQTKLRIRPSGITVTLVLNTFGIARTVRKVLASSPRLSAR